MRSWRAPGDALDRNVTGHHDPPGSPLWPERTGRGRIIQADYGSALMARAESERLDPVRLDTPLARYPGHRREQDFQLRGQEPGRPVRDPQPLRRPAFPASVATTISISSICAGRPDRRSSPGAMMPPRSRRVPPADHRRPRHPRHSGNLRIRHPVREHHPGPDGTATPSARRDARSLSQLVNVRPLCEGQLRRGLNSIRAATRLWMARNV